MRIRLYLLLLLISSLASAQMIEFEEPDWQVAMDKAKKEGKLLMVYLNTLWCEPCLDMEENTFQDAAVHDFYSENFVNVPFDAEGFPGAEIADRYEVNVFPGFLFINSYGELIHKGCGWMDEEMFLNLANNALDESKTLINHKKRFALGDRDPKFLADYSYLLDEACVDATSFVNAFFKDLPQEKWVEEAAWTMINLNIYNPYSPQFEFLITSHDLFATRYGKDTVDAKVYDVLLRQFIQIYEGEDLTLFANQALQKIMSDLDFKQKGALQSMVELQYAELVGNWDLYGSSAIKVINEQAVSDPDQLNEFAWKFYLYVENEKQLNAAISWMEKTLRTQKTATSLDTYASLLFKMGRTKEAMKWGKEALNKAEDELEELTHYQLQLEKYKLVEK
ncbi:MAG: thioredoxin-related protein [Cyclobacteriaceae bacterium]|jgi:thioredoxin-related protein